MASTTDHMMAQDQASGSGRAGQGVLATGLLGSWFAGLNAWLENRATQRNRRDCYRALLGRDEHMLRDLGVTRLDLMHYLERLDGR